MSYTITLADGTKLENLRLNGNNLIADYEVTEETFKYNLSSVDIENDGPDPEFPMFGIELGHHENMELVALQHGLHYMEQGEYWFVIAEIPESESRTRAIESGVNDAYEATAELGVEVADHAVTLDGIMNAVAELGVELEAING